jgi:hypothetical protein
MPQAEGAQTVKPTSKAYLVVKPIPKTYLYGTDSMTFAEAKKKFPHPLLMERATMRDTREECQRVLLRNIAEIRRILHQMEDQALDRCVATPASKMLLVGDANVLHDWRISLNMISGSCGCPHLWQE